MYLYYYYFTIIRVNIRKEHTSQRYRINRHKIFTYVLEIRSTQILLVKNRMTSFNVVQNPQITKKPQ